MDFTKFAQRINDAISGMRGALAPMGNLVPMKADKPGEKKEKKKTKKGAVHTVGLKFRVRKLASVKPAQYRRLHLGVVTIEPNYKKPHAAPRWRNRWISPL